MGPRCPNDFALAKMERKKDDRQRACCCSSRGRWPSEFIASCSSCCFALFRMNETLADIKLDLERGSQGVHNAPAAKRLLAAGEPWSAAAKLPP